MEKEGAYGKVFTRRGIATKFQYLIVPDKRGRSINNITLREGAILNVMNNPNIVKPLKTYRMKAELLIEMNEMFDLRETKDLETTIRTAIEGILYLHNSKIIHGDIKRSNILINKSNESVIIDFGLFKYDNCSYNTVTTWPYISPEVFQEKEVCYASDIWALGVVIFELLLKDDIHRMIKKKYPNYKFEKKKEGDVIYPAYKYVLELMERQHETLLLGMLDPNPDTRWTAKKCYEYLTGLKAPTYSINFIKVDPIRVDGRREMIQMIENIISINKFPPYFIYFWIGLHDKYLSLFPVDYDDYLTYCGIFLEIVLGIFDPFVIYTYHINDDNFINLIHKLPSLDVVDTVVKICDNLEYNLIYKGSY